MNLNSTTIKNPNILNSIKQGQLTARYMIKNDKKNN